MRALGLAIVAGLVVTLAGCSSHRLTDQQYQEICYAYSRGQSALGLGDRVAIGYAIDYMHLSRQDAADALAIARREYCP